MAESWKAGCRIKRPHAPKMQRRGNAMNNQHPTAQAVTDEYPWLRDGSVPHSREDRIAEALALIALIFALGVGVVIALLPVSANAASTAASSLELKASKTAPVRSGGPLTYT
jgi:hypothetical protein